jgi:hypothetical protein
MLSAQLLRLQLLLQLLVLLVPALALAVAAAAAPRQHVIHAVADQADDIAAFWRWLSAGGVDTSHLELAFFEGYGRGIRTRVAIQEGDFFVRVPRNMTITSSVARMALGNSCAFCAACPRTMRLPCELRTYP